jgi:trans-2,3-dihydro-3-hydroxyanthranilate isomerase
MAGHRYVITDVFATKKYSGNQLATVFHDGRMPDEEMQEIAAEFGFSETTFIMSREPINGGYPVRIFTPRSELDFAGHPTLGTAHVLLHHVLDRLADRVTLSLKVGPIPVHVSGSSAKNGALWMRQNPPTFESGSDPEVIAPILGLDIDEVDARWPVSEVSTGHPFTIVPLRSMESLKRARVDPDRYDAWIATVEGKGILVFTSGGHTAEQDLSVRVFVPHIGIPEDPATGSANGCLAAYLVRNRCLGSSPIDVRVGQGYEIDRPSELLLRAGLDDDVWSIEVGGRVIEIATGSLRA